MSHRWGETKTLKFVQIYRQEQCLWDVSHYLYRNNFTRDKAYKNIIHKMGDPGLTVADVKTKIKNLRSTYYQELKKVSDSLKGRRFGEYKPAVPWFDELHVVMKDVARMKSSPMDPIAPATVVKQEPNFLIDQNTNGSSQENDAQVEEELRQESPSSSTIVDTSNVNSEKSKNNTDLEKECEMFGRYVAACLLRLSSERRFAAENSIFQMLMREKVAFYEEENIKRKENNSFSIQGPYPMDV